jgi:membrane protein DedA with SNARE-associated domain
MDLSSPASILAIIEANGYFIMLVLMILEGPIITYISAFAASLGVFNVYAVFILSVLGNIIPDIVLYSIGKISSSGKTNNFLKSLGLTKERINKLEKKFRKHAVKSIIFVKFVPGFPVPGLIFTGFSKINFKKFFLTCLIINVVGSIIFVSLGFYSGIAAENFLKYLNLKEYILIGLVVLSLALYFLIKWLYKKFGNSD